MGNKPCTIGIRTDQSTYDAGSVVSGTIYVSVTTAQPLEATSLNLSFVGEERVVIHHTTTESHTDSHGRTHHNRHRDHYERSNCIFYKFDYPIANFHNNGNVIARGQYEYPFQVTLPADLPGCMSCTKGQSRCDIQYQMTAHIVQPNKSIFTSSPTFTKPFGVLGKSQKGGGGSQENVAGIVLPPEVVPVKTCCCFGKGTMTLQCQIDKSILCPNESLEIQFTGKNQSTVKVHNVKVKLDEVVEWRAHGHTEKCDRSAAERLLGGSDEMPEFQELPQRRTHYFGTPDHDATTSLTMTPHRKTFLVVPNDIRDSYHGNLMEVRHMVTVTLVTSGGCCTTSPESCIALQVCRRPSGVTSSPIAPTATEAIYNDNTMNMLNPTAPTEEEVEPEWSSSPPPAYAPPASHNINNHSVGKPSTPPFDSSSAAITIPEAEPVLPVDWSAQTANVVEVPMAQAMLLDLDNPYYDQQQQQYPTPSAPPSGSYS